MTEDKHLEFLDSILKFIASSQFSIAPNPPKYIFKEFVKKHPNAHEPTFDKAIEKLCNDGYLDKSTEPNGADAYKITFEGIVFKEFGGYQQRLANQNAENTRVASLERFQKVTANRMTYLTIVLAFSALIAAVFYLVELYWKYGWFRF